MKISNRAARIAPSLTLEISAKANEMKSRGISVISFGAGEPDFRTPDYIVEAGKKALDMGLTKYTPVSGTPDLKREICNKFKVDNNLDYSPSNIVVSCGAKGSLFHAMSAILDDGDEVIIPSPYWLTYPEIVGMCNAKCVFVPTKSENQFKMTAEELKDAITTKTKCLILNSPSNPTGAVYTRKELELLAKVLEDTDIYVISDEIYEKLVFGVEHVSIASISEKMKEKTIVVNGVSKTYAMTGWRIGYLACEASLAKAITSFQSHSTSNATSISQYAAAVALSGGESFISTMVNTFNNRRLLALKQIENIKELTCIKPEGAFYIFICIDKLIGKKYMGRVIENSMDFAKLLLDKGVAVIPGKPFGLDNYFRISYAISLDDITEGFNRIKSFIDDLD